MIDLDTFIKNSDMKGVLGCEYASHKHHLSTCPPNPVIVFQQTETSVSNTMLHIIPTKDLDLEFTTKFTEGLRITNRERTICDMIRFGTEERYIYESLEEYFRQCDSEELLKVARHYGIEDSVLEYIRTLDDWIADFYE